MLLKNSPSKLSHIFFISIVGSSRIVNNPSSISGKKVRRSKWGTECKTDSQDIKNCLVNVFLVYIRSRNKGMKAVTSKQADSVTMSYSLKHKLDCIANINFSLVPSKAYLEVQPHF